MTGLEIIRESVNFDILKKSAEDCFWDNRPAKANYSRDVEDPEVREKIRKVVNKLIKR
ncbi:MAG: hypothetical protein N2510_05495 [Ignavibacteria bacterium]|nr:hypothetical protein [Ignavibacteria bacterium]